MLTCAVLLFLTCGTPRPAAALTVATAGASLADQYITQRNLERGGQELNPAARPFENHGRAIAYASTAAENIGAAWLADRMRHSPRWHRLAWLPQAAAIGGHVAALTITVRTR